MTGPSSALSATVTLAGANPSGGDYSVEIDRHADLAAYTETYNPPQLGKTGTYPLTVRFYAQAGGTGDVVAVGNGMVTIDSNGNGIGVVTTVNNVNSVTVPAGQSVVVGQTTQLTFSARDFNNHIVAVTPGSAMWTLKSGSDVASLTKDGVVSGTKLGAPTVYAVVDGVESSVATVRVNNDPNGDNVVVNFDDLSTGVSSIAGTTITADAQLTNQYQSRYGVSFSSAAGYAAVINLGAVDSAPTPPNGITSADKTNKLEYDPSNPVVITFSDPLDATKKGVTKSVSLTADLNGQPVNSGTMKAYDVNGSEIGSVDVIDNGGEVFTLSFPTAQIHEVRFLGAPLHNASGIGVDNLTFGPVIPAP